MKAVPPKPLAENLREKWMLADGVAFLNHGSFGATPREIYTLADDWRRKIEAEPIEILGRQWMQLVEEAKAPVARFLNANPAQLGFVTNATEGVNSVLHTLDLKPGDELVTTTHVYHAVRQAMKFTAARSGAEHREIHIPLLVNSADEIAEKIISGLSPRTRLLILDHVTSPTALVYPIDSIARACRERHIDLLIDGAHAPGMTPLDLTALEKLGVTWYTGNLHKWCCAPKGAAFLFAANDRVKQTHPAVISHWYGETLSEEFHWQGTRDYTGWLCAGAAIDFIGRFGWERVQQHNHAMATWAHEMLCERLKVDPISPLDGSLLGSMATVRLPPRFQSLSDDELKALNKPLYKMGVEAPLVPWRDGRFVRVSCQIYNTPEEYERLADAIMKL